MNLSEVVVVPDVAGIALTLIISFAAHRTVHGFVVGDMAINGRDQRYTVVAAVVEFVADDRDIAIGTGEIVTIN
jgi:hypothetical protein